MSNSFQVQARTRKPHSKSFWRSRLVSTLLFRVAKPQISTGRLGPWSFTRWRFPGLTAFATPRRWERRRSPRRGWAEPPWPLSRGWDVRWTGFTVAFKCGDFLICCIVCINTNILLCLFCLLGANKAVKFFVTPNAALRAINQWVVFG